MAYRLCQLGLCTSHTPARSRNAKPHISSFMDFKREARAERGQSASEGTARRMANGVSARSGAGRVLLASCIYLLLEADPAVLDCTNRDGRRCTISPMETWPLPAPPRPGECGV